MYAGMFSREVSPSTEWEGEKIQEPSGPSLGCLSNKDKASNY